MGGAPLGRRSAELGQSPDVKFAERESAAASSTWIPRIDFDRKTEFAAEPRDEGRSISSLI
jgi:hypothetical protein